MNVVELALFPDELPIPNTTLSDLDQGYFERQFETFAEMPIEDTGLSLERLLTNLKLWDGTTLTMAGILLFGRNPQAHLPFAMISAVHFRGFQKNKPPKIMKGEVQYGRTISPIPAVVQIVSPTRPWPAWSN